MNKKAIIIDKKRKEVDNLNKWAKVILLALFLIEVFVFKVKHLISFMMFVRNFLGKYLTNVTMN